MGARSPILQATCLWPSRPPPPEGGSALIRIFQRSKLRRGASHPTATAGGWGGLRIHSQDFRSQIRAFSTPQRPPLCNLS